MPKSSGLGQDLVTERTDTCITDWKILNFTDIAEHGDSCARRSAEAELSVIAMIKHKGPVYLQGLGKEDSLTLHKKKLDFKIGKGIVDARREGCNDYCQLDDASSCFEDTSRARIISMPTIKPIDEGK